MVQYFYLYETCYKAECKSIDLYNLLSFLCSLGNNLPLTRLGNGVYYFAKNMKVKIIALQIYKRFCNRPYSKVNKSTRAKVAAIFSLPFYCNCIFCVVATIRKYRLICKVSSLLLLQKHRTYKYTNPEVKT
jgi:hypothetical protein